jgi:hypothetical protein
MAHRKASKRSKARTMLRLIKTGSMAYPACRRGLAGSARQTCLSLTLTFLCRCAFAKSSVLGQLRSDKAW